MFPDIPHEQDRAIFREKRGRSGIRDRNWKLKAALGFIPKLAIAIKTKPDLLIVDDHFLQCAHKSLLVFFGDELSRGTRVGPGGLRDCQSGLVGSRPLGARPPSDRGIGDE